MSRLPEKELLEACEVYGCGIGITKGMLYDAVAVGALRRISIAGRKRRGKFLRRDVVRVFKLEERNA
jgi:hypothetical protein